MHDFDEDNYAKLDAQERVPFLEMGCVMPPLLAMSGKLPLFLSDPITVADNMPTDKPRVIKSHMPFEFLPPKLLDTCKGSV